MNAVWKLFIVFLKIGLLSIGGGYAVIPLIQEQVVEKYSWISRNMFTDIITISQMTPGPLAVNTSTFVGLQVHGITGALAATIGCILCGIIISLLLYQFFQTHLTSAYVLEVLNGFKSASLGLISSAALTIIGFVLYGSNQPELDFFSLHWMALVLFCIMIVLLRKWKLHPLAIIFISGLAGFVFEQ